MRKTQVSLITALILFFAASAPVLAQSSEEAGQAAEQKGDLRNAVTHYITALQATTEGSPAEQRLREKVIKLVQELNPPPVVPEEAVRMEGRAEAALRSAKTPNDFMDAAKEYNKALRLAPWVANYYYNLGRVLEKAGQRAEAIRNLKLYLLAAPNANDATDVKKMIAGIEYDMEKEKGQQERSRIEQERSQVEADQERRRQAAFLPGLAGTWLEGKGEETKFRHEVSVNGDSIKIVWTGTFYNGRWYDDGRRPLRFEGKVDGLKIVGTHTRDNSYTYKNGGVFTRPMTGTISPDGRRIHLDYTNVIHTYAENNVAYGWQDRKESKDLERQ